MDHSDFSMNFNDDGDSFTHFQDNIDQQTFQNMGFLFSGYNYIKRNPFPKEGLDPGFTLSPLFKSVYQGTRTADRRTLIPKGVHGFQSVSCQSHVHKYSYRSATEYEKYVNNQVGAHFALGAISASFNKEHSERLELLHVNENMMVRGMKTCFLYSLKLDRFNPPPLHQSFLDALRKTRPHSKRNVLKFIGQYGTHFLSKIDMGYRTGVDIIMSKNTYSKMTNVEDKLEFMVSGGPAGFSISNTQGQSTREEFSTSSIKTYKFALGKQVQQDGNGNHNLAPLKYEMLPMTSLPGLGRQNKIKLQRIFMLNMKIVMTEIAKKRPIVTIEIKH